MKKCFLIFLSISLSCFFILGCSKSSSNPAPNDDASKTEDNSTDSTNINNDIDDLSYEEKDKDPEKTHTEYKSENIQSSQSNTNSALLETSKDKLQENKSEEKQGNSQSINQSSTHSKEKDYDLYTSQLGFTINFPKSWNNLYTINEDENGLYVLFKQTVPGDYGQGILFAIIKKVDDSDEFTIDTIGDKRYLVAKDVLYIIGGPTDLNFSPDSPDFKTFEDMHNQCADVINTIKITN